jgi:hypothetical protein
MRFIFLEPGIRNKKCKLKGEDDDNIYVILDYDKNFYCKNTLKLFDPFNFTQFWVNHKDINLI